MYIPYTLQTRYNILEASARNPLMAVYVDAAIHTWRNRLWCHLIADDEDELHEFARQLGLKRESFQTQSSLDHYDITKELREVAIEMGAVQLSRSEMVARIRAARER